MQSSSQNAPSLSKTSRVIAMMHEVFSNQDVIVRVVPHLSKGALVALSCACRAFSDPALDHLWREMTSLDPLYLCFPSDVCTKDAAGRLVRAHLPKAFRLIIYLSSVPSCVADYLSERPIGNDSTYTPHVYALSCS